MPGGRPVSSKLLIERWDDGRFQVTLYGRHDSKGFRVLSRFRGAPPVERGAQTEAEARDLADTIWRQYQRGGIERPDPEPLTLRELVDAFANQAHLRGATQRSYQQVLDLFTRHVGEQRAPRRVYRLDVVDFLDTVEAGGYHPRGQAASPRTIATYHRTLRACFRWAIKKGWRGDRDDPTEDIEIDTTHSLGAWLPFSEWDAYLTECSPAHELRSGFVLETGMRESEVVHARPEWMRGQVGRRAIYIGPDDVTGWRPKGSSRVVPLTDRAERYLSRARAMWPASRFLFCGDDGLSALGNLARDTRTAMDRAGVTRTNFNGLRRSAGAHWLDCGLSLYEVSRLLGHADIRTTQRWYADISDTTLVAAIAQVERARREHADREADGDLVLFGAALFGRR